MDNPHASSIDSMLSDYKGVKHYLTHFCSNMSSLVAADKLLRDVLQNETDKNESKIVPNDFYWDRILFYLVTALLGLSFLNISVEFFRGSTVQCFTPTEIPIDRDHFAFLNNHCYGSLPHSQYYLIFLLVAAILIIAPHYLWSAYFDNHFEFFFDSLKKLDRLHNPETGERDPKNFNYIEDLEQRFNSSSIYIAYALKLITQLLFSFLVLLLNSLYFKNEDFEADFTCIVDLNSTVWPYRMDIDCVYNSLRLLWFLRAAAFLLIIFACLTSFFGITWCFGRHVAELGAKDIAHFCFESCLLPDKHNFPSVLQITKQLLCSKFSNKCKLHFKRLIHPRIRNDLDFLLLRLFNADSGYAQVFRDIQIHKELKIMFERDHELLHLLLRTHADMIKQELKGVTEGASTRIHDLKSSLDLKARFFGAGFGNITFETTIYASLEKHINIDERDRTDSQFRNILFGFFGFAKPNNYVAMDIGFETNKGYSLILARAFNSVTTIYFDRYFRNDKDIEDIVLQKKYAAGYDITVCPDNILSQKAGDISQADKKIFNLFEDERIKGIDLIMVGPITDRPKIVSTNLLINKAHERKHICHKAKLIAVRPLLIEEKPVLQFFQQYKPPVGLFEEVIISDELLDNEVTLYDVHENGSYTQFKPEKSAVVCVGVMCSNVWCIFEFCVYEYKLNVPDPIVSL